MKHLVLLFYCALMVRRGVEGQAPPSAQLEAEMQRNREYQCVASCFSLGKDGKSGSGSKPAPECLTDYKTVSQDCLDQTNKLSPIIEKDTGRYFVGTAKKNWHEASRWCRENGMQLASLETEVENNIVGGIFPAGKDEYWISGCDHVIDNQWYWVETGEDFDYRNFDVGKPNLYTKKDILRCVFMKTEPGSPSHLKWSDANCDEERKFVCEMPEICYKQYCNTN